MKKKFMLKNFKKNIAKALVSVISLSSMSLGGMVKADEANLSLEQSVVLNTFESLNQTTAELNQQDYVAVTNLFFRDIESGYFNINVLEENLDFEGIKALALDTKEGFFTSVTIPIVGEEYNIFSNITIIYDSNNDVVSYVETVLTKSFNGTFLVTSYENGKLIKEDVTDIDYVTNEEILMELDYFNSMSNSHSRSAGCLAAVLGIGGATAAVIYTICGLSCTGLAVPICVACIGAYASIGGASVTAVVKCFT